MLYLVYCIRVWLNFILIIVCSEETDCDHLPNHGCIKKLCSKFFLEYIFRYNDFNRYQRFIYAQLILARCRVEYTRCDPEIRENCCEDGLACLPGMGGRDVCTQIPPTSMQLAKYYQ